MAWVALACPQCSAPLPRVAIWRSVKCGSCGALITRTESMVQRDTFRQALNRARQGTTVGDAIRCGGESYQLMQRLGTGDVSEVYLAQRMGPLPFVATIKLSTTSSAAARYAREAQVLTELRDDADDGAAAAYTAQRLPEVMGIGVVDDGSGRHALILRHPPGCWGTLEALHSRFPQGIDPRHAVWIWRRILDVLHFIHTQGWSHGDVRPEHALVQPQDHGVHLISWGSAQKGAGLAAQSADLSRSARVVQVLVSSSGSLASNVPPDIAQLLTRAAQDTAFCQAEGASGLDTLLRTAARAAFGPPAFLPLTL